MLEREQILRYKEEIRRAHVQALNEITTAELVAKETLCEGCDYCLHAGKHRQILEQTTEELLALVDTLKEGERSRYNFAKVMNHEFNLYRGFIIDTGEYVPIHNKMNHSDYREKYAKEYGEERAYRMINIHGGATKTKVLFCDRKSAPNIAQYVTLRELLIDARGDLSFQFQLDTNHPQPCS